MANVLSEVKRWTKNIASRRWRVWLGFDDDTPSIFPYSGVHGRACSIVVVLSSQVHVLAMAEERVLYIHSLLKQIERRRKNKHHAPTISKLASCLLRN